MAYKRQYPEDSKSFYLQDIEVYDGVFVRFSFHIIYAEVRQVCLIKALYKEVTQTAMIDHDLYIIFSDMPLKWVEKGIERLKVLVGYKDMY